MTNHWYSAEERATVCGEYAESAAYAVCTTILDRVSCPDCLAGMQSKLSAPHIEQAEQLLGYFEQRGPGNGWEGDAVQLLRAMLPDWSAFKESEAMPRE